METSHRMSALIFCCMVYSPLSFAVPPSPSNHSTDFTATTDEGRHWQMMFAKQENGEKRTGAKLSLTNQTTCYMIQHLPWMSYIHELGYLSTGPSLCLLALSSSSFDCICPYTHSEYTHKYRFPPTLSLRVSNFEQYTQPVSFWSFVHVIWYKAILDPCWSMYLSHLSVSGLRFAWRIFT